MASPFPPLDTGDEQQRWQSYLDPKTIDPTTGFEILRNKVKATSFDELRQREDDAFAIRQPTLRLHRIPHSYDLAGLQEIHRHLFQDVYEWAGELRTVNLAKGGSRFLQHDQIEPFMVAVADVLTDSNNLTAVNDAACPEALARVYAAVNRAHPFREGNGRTNREFTTALAAESGRKLDWARVQGFTNDQASIAANNGDLAPMVAMFQRITAAPTTPGQRPAATARVMRAQNSTTYGAGPARSV